LTLGVPSNSIERTGTMRDLDISSNADALVAILLTVAILVVTFV
jgi:hypothetical protein